MKLVCSECESPLYFVRTDDGEAWLKIDENGKVSDSGSKSNGGTHWECSKDSKHELSKELCEKLEDISEELSWEFD